MDAAKNFAKVTVSLGYDAAAVSIVLTTGHAARLPAVPFNAVWHDATTYPDPSDDPNVEVVRVTNIAVETLTITRAQESTSASTKNTAGKVYKLIAGPTAKLVTDIVAELALKASDADLTALDAATTAALALKATDADLDALDAATAIALAGKANTAHNHSAADLTSGTLPDARFPAVLPAISGANLTNLPAGVELGGWYNVQDHGLVGDGVTDDTAALQALIDTVGAAGGGTIYFPDDGPYLIAGALQDGARRNAQLLLPAVAITAQHYSITFKGYVAPACSPSGSTVIAQPRGTVIKSTLASGSGTAPAVIGGRGPVGGLFDECNYLHVRFEDLIFQTVANPSYGCLNLQRFTSVYLKDLIVHAGTRLDVPGLTQPTTTTSYGIRLPQFNSGILQEIRGQVNVFGFYTGIRCGELMHAENIGAWACARGLEFPFSYHASLIERYLQFWCPIGAIWAAVHPVEFQQWDIERAGAGQWYSPVAEISDSGNNARGEVVWLTVLAGVGRVSLFTVSGGANIITRELGAAVGAPTPPAFDTAEIGVVSNTTVVVTFSVPVKAANYATGVIIKVNGTPATISSATRQSNKAIVRYLLSAPVTAGQTVTFNYEAGDGFITNEAGTQLADIVEAVVTNNVGSSILLSDTFTDTNGVAVTSHTMDTGPGWTKIEGGALNVQIQGNKGQTQVDAVTAYAYVADAGQANVTIVGTFAFGVWGVNHYCELILRETDASNYWKLSINGGATNNMKIVRRQAGTDNTEAQVSKTLTAGVEYLFTVVALGDDISFTVDGTQLTENNSFQNTATKHGFRMYHASGAVSTIDNFQVS